MSYKLDELLRTFRDAVTKRKYHKQCYDCGKFVSKERWVEKDDLEKRPLCAKCADEYDTFPPY